MTTHDNDRADFEAWAEKDRNYSLKKHIISKALYADLLAENDWELWQAARANSGWQAMELIERCANYIERSDLRDLDFGLGFEDYADEICLLAKSITPPKKDELI